MLKIQSMFQGHATTGIKELFQGLSPMNNTIIFLIWHYAEVSSTCVLTVRQRLTGNPRHLQSLTSSTDRTTKAYLEQYRKATYFNLNIQHKRLAKQQAKILVSSSPQHSI
jgi:hypothetical protein